MAKIILQEAALDDLKRLYDFLAQYDDEAAIRAAKCIDEAIYQLARYPELVPVLHGEYRVLSIPFGKRGYSAAHVYDADLDEVLILGIKHQREEFYPFEIELEPDADDDLSE